MSRSADIARARVNIKVEDLGIELGLGIRLEDGKTNKLQLNYSISCCNIRRSAHPLSAFSRSPTEIHASSAAKVLVF